MSYLDITSPIYDLTVPGIYGHLDHGKPCYVMSYQKDISVVKIVAFSDQDMDDHISVSLKSLLGLIIPPLHQVYTSGTRKIIRTDAKTLYVSTEGEARGVLYSRLSYGLNQHAGIFDETAGVSVIRIDGYDILRTLSPLIEHIDHFSDKPSSCRVVYFDDARCLIHNNSVDMIFIYLQRSYAFEVFGRIARLFLPYGLKII